MGIFYHFNKFSPSVHNNNTIKLNWVTITAPLKLRELQFLAVYLSWYITYANDTSAIKALSVFHCRHLDYSAVKMLRLSLLLPMGCQRPFNQLSYWISFLSDLQYQEDNIVRVKLNNRLPIQTEFCNEQPSPMFPHVVVKKLYVPHRLL